MENTSENLNVVEEKTEKTFLDKLNPKYIEEFNKKMGRDPTEEDLINTIDIIKNNVKEEITEIPPGTEYIESEAWIGNFDGYVFKSGDKGQGYYLDTTPVVELNIPEEFEKIITEFIFAFLEVCPEFNNNDLHDDVRNIFTGSADKKYIASLYKYCSDIYPINIFNIMGKNDDLFNDNELKTEFLPGIEFKKIWQDESINTKTKETIWKYLQLILFTIVGNISDMDSFGDTAKLFEMIDEDELKEKLEETFSNMEQMFHEEEKKENEKDDSTGQPSFNMPDVNNIHDHLKGLMGGKLGNLAVEIAEETANELDINENDHNSVKDVFSSMMKNPKKLMGIANKIGSKLEDKMKSGELDEKELMKEASEMFNKMKNTPGMGDIEKMMRSMGGLGKKSKINMNAMQQHFDRQSKIDGMKSRAAKLAEERKEKLRKEEAHRKWASEQPHEIHPDLLKELGIEDTDTFTSGEKPQRTPRPQSSTSKSGGKKKKKKGKK